MNQISEEERKGIEQEIKELLGKRLKGNPYSVIVSWNEGKDKKGYKGASMLFGTIDLETPFGVFRSIVTGTKLNAEMLIKNLNLNPKPIQKQDTGGQYR